MHNYNRFSSDGKTILCRICNKQLEIELYSRSDLNHQDYRCRKCAYSSRKAHLKRYRATLNGQQYVRRSKAKQTIKLRRLVSQLKNRPCADCYGWFKPYQMDFDHRDPSLKVCNVSRIQRSVSKLYREIQKCDVVCANCHRERTHKQQGTLVPEKF